MRKESTVNVTATEDAPGSAGIPDAGRKPPVFLIGSPRSGTTLLHQMFDHHPALALPYESKYIATFHANLAEFGDLHDERNREVLIQSIEKFMRNAWLENETGEWIPGLSDAAPELARKAEPSFAGVIDAIYTFFAAQNGAQRWGDKMATFTRCMPAVLQLFPDAKIVHIIRDGRDVASSILPLSFGPNTSYVAAKKWRNFVQHGLEFADTHPGQVYTLRYEDLIDDPEKYLREICVFIDEPFSGEMLNYHKSGTKRVPRKEIHGQLNKPVNKERSARWKKDLTPDQIRVFEAVAGPLLKKLNYEIVNPHARLSTLDRAVGNLGNRMRWWKPFTHPVGLWDRIKMRVLRKKLRRE
jgi:hypothetical protein